MFLLLLFLRPIYHHFPSLGSDSRVSLDITDTVSINPFNTGHYRHSLSTFMAKTAEVLTGILQLFYRSKYLTVYVITTEKRMF